MWTREALKTRAKAMLKASYWKAFLVSLVVAFFGGLDGGGGINFTLVIIAEKILLHPKVWKVFLSYCQLLLGCFSYTYCS